LYKDQPASIGGNSWTADGRALLFAHGKANEAWELLSSPIAGGAPAAVGLPLWDQFGSISVTADGSLLALSAIRRDRELGVIDNVIGPSR
jgi:hypothetical protein